MRSTLPPSPASMSNTTAGLMLCASRVGTGSSPGSSSRSRLEQRGGAGLLAHRPASTSTGTVTVEQLVGECTPRIPKPRRARPRGQDGCAVVARPHAEAVVAQEDVADAATAPLPLLLPSPWVRGGIGMGLTTMPPRCRARR
jgi:hypothetical protein